MEFLRRAAIAMQLSRFLLLLMIFELSIQQAIAADGGLGDMMAPTLERFRAAQPPAVRRSPDDCAHTRRSAGSQTPSGSPTNRTTATQKKLQLGYEQCPDPNLKTTDFYHQKVVSSQNEIVKNYVSRPVEGAMANCILLGMKFPESQIQTSCVPNRSGRVSRNLPRNCASEPMHRFLAHAINDVAACMNLSPTELFGKFLLESNIQPAALGGAYDGGVGQLTCSMLEDFHPNRAPRLRCPSAPGPGRNRFADMLKHLNSSSLESCQRLAKIAGNTPLASDVRNRCETMYPPENAIKNILYSGYNLADHAEDFEKTLPRQLPHDIRRTLAQRLGVFSHNSPAGARALSRVFASAPRRITNGELNQFMDRAASSTRSTISGYYRSLKGQAQRFRSSGGGVECTPY